MAEISLDRSAVSHGRGFLDRFMMHGGIVVLFLLAAILWISIAEPRFFNRLNLVNVSRNFSLLAIPALAQMMVMTAGGFDLSLGATVALASVVTAAVMAVGATMFPGMEVTLIFASLLAVLAVGAAIGAVNAGLIVTFSLSPFMVTLAMMSVLTGIVLFYTQGIPVDGVSDVFISAIGRGQILGFPVLLYIALFIVAAVVALQRLTPLGRHIYAVGSDARAARLSGVSTKRTLYATYCIASMLAAFTGFLMTARLSSGQGTIGGTLALETIAAAVIGGVSLRGGSGRTEYVALAALFLVIMANGMNLVQIDSKLQTLVLGTVLILALAIERLLVKGRKG